MEQMILANISLDILAILISVMPVFYLTNNQRFREKRNRYFAAIGISNVFMTIGDLADWIMKDIRDVQSWWTLAGLTVLFYVSSAFLLHFFGKYMAEYLNLPQAKKRIFFTVIGILCGIQIFFALISPWTGSIFSVTESGYQRGRLFLISQIIPLFCYLSFCILVLMYRKQLLRREIVFFLLYIFVPLGAGVMQFLMRGIAPINICVAMALMFIFINIQLEQEVTLREQEKELAELRIDIMLSQIQPHFLYNSLSAISHLCRKDPERAQEAIWKFSMFLRENMDSLKSCRPIPFEKELEHAKNYLYLEEYRFGERLHVVYDIRATEFGIPSLTLQPLVENAVCHGVLRREEGGTVRIGTSEDLGAYYVTVEDDGIGMEKAAQFSDNADRMHIGIGNVRERLENMMRASLQIESSDAGTKVTMCIPKEANHALSCSR